VSVVDLVGMIDVGGSMDCDCGHGCVLIEWYPDKDD